MRIAASVTSLSWIPSEAVTGVNKAIFGTGFTHYDDPPPDRIDDLAILQATDRFRFANRLAAWIEVEDEAIVRAGYSGGCVMGSTTIAVGPKQATFAAASFPDICQPVEIDGNSACFVQTVGGHTALPAPRRVNRAPFVAFQAPAVWTTLALTIRADGTSEHDMVGASSFPRHWVYDADGALTAKAGLADFKDWFRTAFGKHTPWGDEDSPAMVTAVETALEREVAARIMRGGEKPSFRRLAKGAVLTEQGSAGDDVYLLLNGVLAVEVDGEPMAEVGPGAILGERALLESQERTSTLARAHQGQGCGGPRATNRPGALAQISEGHRREEHRTADSSSV